MSKNFTQTNPDQLLYENEILEITVLGGIKIEGLDRMRTTLKIKVKETGNGAICTFEESQK